MRDSELQGICRQLEDTLFFFLPYHFAPILGFPYFPIRPSFRPESRLFGSLSAASRLTLPEINEFGGKRANRLGGDFPISSPASDKGEGFLIDNGEARASAPPTSALPPGRSDLVQNYTGMSSTM